VTASAVLVGAFGALVGCGSSGDKSKASGTPRPNPTASATAHEAAIVAAYRAGWAAFLHAIRAPDPADPAVAATTIDPLLTQTRKGLVSDKTEGIVGRGDVTLQHPHVVSVSGDTAVVEDCVYSALVLVFAATGKPVPDQPGGTQPEYDGVRATVALTPSGWKVANQDIKAGQCPLGY
jgi:hypothetical protein